jgi:hypothetical protein
MLRFAPRYGIISPCLKPMHKQARRAAANDNSFPRPDGVVGGVVGCRAGANDDDALLEAALRLFGAHGLSAAQRAYEAAEIAEKLNEPDNARWWKTIGRVLDGGMAYSFDRREGGRR